MEGAQRVRDAGAEAVLQDDDRNGGEEDRHDGGIPSILAPNGMFSQVCEYAERLGIRMKLGYDIPALENLPMRSNERTCKSFLRRGCSNWRESNPCWERDRCGGCFGGYVWDRRAHSRRGRGRRQARLGSGGLCPRASDGRRFSGLDPARVRVFAD